MTTKQELRDRAVHNLLRALQEAGPELSHTWVVHGDPDLEALRDHEGWSTLIRRLSRLRDEPSAPASKHVAAEAEDIEPDSKRHDTDTTLVADRPEEVTDAVAVPASPLRPATLRKWGWLLLAIALAGAAVVAFTSALPWLVSMTAAIPLLTLTAIAAHRSYIAWKERWPELATIPAPERELPPEAPQG